MFSASHAVSCPAILVLINLLAEVWPGRLRSSGYPVFTRNVNAI
jgi:hypothetical protein